MIELLWPAFVLGVLLVFIHILFGIEILKRGVIFTDLAIGQMAAVGVAVSLRWFEGAYAFGISLLFALLGGWIIAIASQRVGHIEAFIGMLYALGASAVMVILSHSAQGLELFQKLLASDILFTTADDLLIPTGLYVCIALLFYGVYSKLQGLMKEFFFFSLLAVTVTSSVSMAGVLVVFVLLIVPAFIALSQKHFSPLFTAWGIGFLAMIIALILSYLFDLPTGYTIVFITALFGVLYGMIFTNFTR